VVSIVRIQIIEAGNHVGLLNDLGVDGGQPDCMLYRSGRQPARS
jgi:hypothetical protein